MEFTQQRSDLITAMRWADRFGYTESVANHFSIRVEEADESHGRRFLINPNLRHFKLVKPSELLLLDCADSSCLSAPNPPDPTAWGLHAAIHRNCDHAKAVVHVHSPYVKVLASLKDMSLPAIDQNTAMFYNNIIYDGGYGGFAFEDEGLRCARLIEEKPHCQILMMGAHGVIAIGKHIAEAFHLLYYFELAAKNYILALQTGRPLNILSDNIAAKTADDARNYPDQSIPWLHELRAILELENDPNL